MAPTSVLCDWGAEIILKGKHAGMRFEELWKSKPGILRHYTNRHLTNTNLISLQRYLVCKHYESCGTEEGSSSRGRAACSQTRRNKVSASLPKKAKFKDRRLCPKLDDEVWAWFLKQSDGIVYPRFGNVIAIATFYKQLIIDEWERQCDKDEAVRDHPPRFPKIGAAWVKRWAKRHGVLERSL